MTKKLKVGVIGCGNILPQYVRGCRLAEAVEIAACADIIPAKAEAAAATFDIPAVHSVEKLLATPEIDIALNLTVPTAHAGISLAALEAGKHVYSEKPLAQAPADGRRILEMATAKGLRVGCAPDTFLGPGLQTCRRLVDEGAIGQPVAATAFMMGSGPESWHPNPAFFYQDGAGPLYDMAPYYLTALINLLGPVVSLQAHTQISFKERIATAQACFGQRIPVEVPTFVTSLLNFDGGQGGVFVTTFDAAASGLPRIELYGSDGTLSVPDPNTFGGPVGLFSKESKGWQEVSIPDASEVARGIGLDDMARAILADRPHRAAGEIAYHVLDVMNTIELAGKTGQLLELASSCGRPDPLPADYF